MDQITRKNFSVRIIPVEVIPGGGPTKQKVWRRRSPNVGYYQSCCVRVDLSFFADVVKFTTTSVPMSCKIMDDGLPPNAAGAAFHNANTPADIICAPMVTNVEYTLSRPDLVEIVNYGSLPGKSYCTDPNVKGIFVKEGVSIAQYGDLGSIYVTITTATGEVVTNSSSPLLLASAEAYSGVPLAPSGLNGRAEYGPTRVVLSWTAAEGHTAYELQRMNGSGPYVTLSPPSVGATSYTDNTPPSGGNLYHLRAVGTYGTSAWASSNVVGI